MRRYGWALMLGVAVAATATIGVRAWLARQAPTTVPSTPTPTAREAALPATWPVVRGGPMLPGAVDGQLPDRWEVRWRHVDAPGGITAAVIGDGRVYAGSLGSGVLALDLDTGELLWRHAVEGGVESPPLLSDGVLYIGTLDAELLALDAATGAVRWRHAAGARITGAPSRLAEGLLLFGSHDSTLRAVHPDTGEAAWSYTAGSYVNGAAAVTESRIVMTSCDASIHLLDPAGERVRAIDTGAYVPGSPALRDGLVYAGIGQDPALSTRLGTSSNGLLAELVGRPHPVVKLRGRLTWRARRESYRDPEGELGVGQQDRRDRIHTAGGLLSMDWTPVAWQAVSTTVDLRVDGYQPVDALRDEPLDGARTRVGLVLSAADDLSFADDRVRLSPVLQLHLLDNRLLGEVPYGDTAVAPDARRVYAPFTPRLGLRLRPLAALAIKANIGRSFRPPDFTELFGDRGAVVGNSELVPETGWAWDAGVRLESPADPRAFVALEASYFGRRLTDAIVYVQNAQRTQIPINFGDARIHGVEAAGQLRLAGVVELDTSLTWIDARNLDPREAYAGNQLPRVPEWEAWAELSGRWRDHLRAGINLSHTAGNYWDATNWYRAAPRTLLGLSVRVQPGPRWPTLELEIRNLTDRRLQTVPRDPLNPDDGAMVVQPITDFAGYPLPGRTVLVTVGGVLGES